jgi:lariat debranching enzyme
MSCPDKYRDIGQFHQFYEKNDAPYVTFFVGGNHEASNLMNETYYGGWICKNIFYIGRAGVINYRGIRIAGLSGIYNKFDYFKGHYEKNLLKDIKNIYHVREFEIAKLGLVIFN